MTARHSSRGDRSSTSHRVSPRFLGVGLGGQVHHPDLGEMLASPAGLTNPGWWRQAHCDASIGDEFFELNNRPDREAVRTVCRTCPVRVDCLEHALLTHEPDGMWGGLTPGERDRLRRAVRTLGARGAAETIGAVDDLGRAS